MKKKIAYQGTKASFSEMAIDLFLGSSVESVGKITFEEVFNSLESGEVELAALPVENSLIGPIVENLDLIARSDVHIIGELCLPVEHCLVGKKGSKLEEIKEVLSHPKALAQCTRFFQKCPWIKPIEHFDTAGAAREVAMRSEGNIAAIGSRKTAEIYGLELIANHLEDISSNTTRFVFLQKGPASVAKRHEGKCSLILTLEHAPKALVAALKVLGDHGLNMTQIVSRPIREKPFEYLFFIDFLFSRPVTEVLEALKKHTQTLKLVGVYAPAS